MSKILALEDSVHYVRTNAASIFPPNESQAKTMGNIPHELHANIQGYAKKYNLKMFEVVAGLWDFYEQYEEIYADELKKQRTGRRFT